MNLVMNKDVSLYTATLLAVTLLFVLTYGRHDSLGKHQGVYTNKFEFKIQSGQFEFVKKHLVNMGFTYTEKIVDIYMFEMRGNTSVDVSREGLDALMDTLNGKVTAIHRVRKLYVSFGDPIEPPFPRDQPVSATASPDKQNLLAKMGPVDAGDQHAPVYTQRHSRRHAYLVCPPYYDAGQGIDAAWKAGYTGAGVIVAVTDVGVDINHPELQQNIDKEMSYNFVDNNNNPEPKVLHNYITSTIITNHGTACSSVIAGLKDNNLCSCGVAHHATIVALKIISFESWNFYLPAAVDDSTIAKALSHHSDRIHVYSNSWDFSAPLKSVSLATASAVQYGVNKGRHGKGCIYIFPAGKPSNAFTNSIYTIAVNSIGLNGSIPRLSMHNSATLVSAFGQGRTRDTQSMVTAYHNSTRHRCTNTFEGSSAATAIVAGIAALVLQANPALGWRDVQHIFVNSAVHTGLSETQNFRKNAAGKYFHDHFGFGLLDAERATSLAKKWKHVSPLKHINLTQDSIIRPASDKMTIYFKTKNCSKHCLSSVEHVRVSIELNTAPPLFIMTLISPSYTHSNLLHLGTDDGIVAASISHVSTTHFWGERAEGVWALNIKGMAGTFSTRSIKISVYGTSRSSRDHTEADEDTDHSDKDNAHKETHSGNSCSIFTCGYISIVLFVGIPITLVVVVGLIYHIYYRQVDIDAPKSRQVKQENVENPMRSDNAASDRLIKPSLYRNPSFIDSVTHIGN